MNEKMRDSEPQEAAWLPAPLRYLAGVMALACAFALILAPRYGVVLDDPVWYFLATAAVIFGVVWFVGKMSASHAWQWTRSFAVALGIALTIRWAVAEPYKIPSSSMEPTLHGDNRIGRGDRVFVNKWVYGVRYPFLNKRIWNGTKPQRWDIVVFQTPEPNAVHKTLVKRIVGLPGERVQIRNGRVYINDQPLALPPSMPADLYYTNHGTYGVRPETEYSLVPPGHYLVLGDNSANSRDGRYFGWLPEENIVGRVACIWWPPSRWRDFTGFTQTWWWRTLVALVILGVFLRLFIGCSVAVPRNDSSGTDHILVSFISLGLRLPMTPLWLIRWRKIKPRDVVLFRAQQDGTTVILLGQVIPPSAAPNRLSTKKKSALSTNQDGALYVMEGFAVNGLSGGTVHSISERDVFGKVVAVWWPPRHWTRLTAGATGET
jgi:signal peptidase I